MNIIIAPVVIFLAVHVVLSATLNVTKPGEFKELPKASANLSITSIFPIIVDMLCKAECLKKKDTIEQQNCTKKNCIKVAPTKATKATSFGKVSTAPTITAEEKAVLNYVNEILPDKVNSDPEIVISILRATLCKLCNENQSTNERIKCELKYCLVTKPSGISVNLGAEKLVPIS